LFRVDEIPDFIDLHPFAGQVAQHAILVGRARAPGIDCKLDDGVLARARQSSNSAD
jgi:hypothetical protein